MGIFMTGAGGYVGGTIARRLIDAGYTVRGLVRGQDKAERLTALGVEPVLGTLDDHALLADEARRSEGVINVANSDHAGAVAALIDGLKGSGKPLLHTSGSGVIGDDARGDVLSDAIYDEDTAFVVRPERQARRELDLGVLAAANQGVRSVVICPSHIYGVGLGANTRSMQIPYLLDQARESGVTRVIGKGINRWSNVHVEDAADLYVLALRKAPAGAFYFVENGEDSFADIGAAIAGRLHLGPVQSWTVEQAAPHWGEKIARFILGNNSRVRARRARNELGWAPRQTSALAWIARDMPV